MNPRRIAKLRSYVVLAQAAWAAVEIARGDLRAAAVAAGAVVLMLAQSSWATVLAGAVAAFFGSWVVVALIVVSSALAALVTWRDLFHSNSADGTQLASSVDGLPPRLQRNVRHGADPLTTVHLVQAAIDANPDRWRALVRVDAGKDDTWDGPLVDPRPRSGPATLCAAEACALGAFIADELERDLDEELLGGAAIAVVGSAAQEMAMGGPAAALASVTGAHDLQLAHVLARFSRTPAGSDIWRRVQFQEAGLTRRQLFEADTKAALLLLVFDKVVGAAAVVAVLASLPVDAAKWVWRLPRRMQSRIKARTRTERTSVTPPPVHAPVRKRPGRVEKATEPWKHWSPAVRWLWLVVRPAWTVATVAVSFASLRPITASLVSICVITVRPLTRAWAGALLAVVIAPLAPLVSGCLAGRLITTEILMQLRGASASGLLKRRRAAHVAVQESRRTLCEVGASDEVLHGLRTRTGSDSDDRDLLDAFDDGIELVVSTWCDGDAGRWLWLVRALRRGVHPGETDRAVPSLEEGLARLALVEAVGSGIVRFLSVAGAAAAATLVTDRGPLSLGQIEVSSGAAAACLGALMAVATTGRELSPFGILLSGAAAWQVFGGRALAVAAISLLAALIARRGRDVLSGFLVAGRRTRFRSLTVRETGWRLHGLWDAATIAAREQRVGIAIRLYDQIAREAGIHRPGLAAMAQARLGVLMLGRGQADSALAAANSAWTTLQRHGDAGGRRGRALALASIGEVRFALGQEVLTFLPNAVAELPAAWPESVRAAAVCAEAFARAGHPDAALDVLSRARRPLTGALDFTWLIESEIAVAQALEASGRRAQAVSRLSEVMSMVADAPDLVQSGEPRSRFVVASGRAALLAGSLECESGDSGRARTLLEQAITRLAHASASLQATAHVMHGASLAAEAMWEGSVGSVERGIALLETQRRQITRGEARTHAIVSEARLYRTALLTLKKGQDAGVVRAGEVAAVLIEALHQSALARTLREGSGDLTGAAAAVLDEVGAFEAARPDGDGEPLSPELSAEQATQLESFRGRLSTVLSEQFARTYLPTEVHLADIRMNVYRSHVLSYHFPEDDSWPDGFCVWIPPTGSPVLHEVTVGPEQDVRSLLEYFAGLTPNIPKNLMRQVGVAQDFWSRLGMLLLPTALRAELMLSSDEPIHLLVVPDRLLSRLPWAALCLDDGRLLVEVASTQVVPSLDLIEPRAAPSLPSREVLFHGDAAVFEAAALPTATIVTPVWVRADLDAALENGDLAGVYLAVHGSGQGMDQYLDLDDGSRLSAASALQLQWPPWIVLASCFVGGLEHRAGSEPLGFAIACVLGGCRSVIGGVVSVGASASDALAIDTIARLLRGVHPARALREAQHTRRDQVVSDWAAFCCVSRVQP